ncbi:Flp pilus assembly protein CpaB [Streptomyces alkaliphilus]|uniref:Flp pilus assembly protein CpaB n=1 Tax=Streptomyces alkaliphilus TaxID=1472722 RepID=A0A7W3TGH8_9ACTN|nr:Flp pilus assembly protein CpaB [Streptomyces alkaliphilus]MBB0246412.1 Flp pilus assembly protein CpaB [Streptomyces alkaliphilus]MQS09576.1 Flp pilus assembly protein CpaB [Streptomyces alkaliphilus]
MNARQRRGAVLLTFSALLALAAFLAVLAVVRDAQSKVGPEVTAYEVAEEIEPHQPLDPAWFTEVDLPERYLPDSAVTDLSDIRDMVAVGPLSPGALLQRDMIAPIPELAEGEQEIAVLIDASTGVAGKIRPGSTINLYAAYTVEDVAEDSDRRYEMVRLMVNNARVIEVGDLTDVEQDRVRTQAVPITFALDHLDAQRVTFAEAFAEQIRLALVAPGDEREIPEEERTYTIIGDLLENPHIDPLQFFQE